MKKILIVLFAISPFLGMAQKKKKEIVKESFEVNGVCGMCKSRIEKAAFSIKGVKSATWDIPTHQFTVLYDKNRLSIDQLHEVIAKVGHDTPEAKAADDVYDALPMCCLYDREKDNEQ